MAQISVPKDQLQSTLDKIREEGGKLTASKLSEDKKEVVLIYIEGNSTTAAQVAQTKPEPIMVNGPEGLKPVEGQILEKPKVDLSIEPQVKPLFTPKSK
jgi:hypothetical protein